jgi:hypothetical protein
MTILKGLYGAANILKLLWKNTVILIGPATTTLTDTNKSTTLTDPQNLNTTLEL